MTIDEMRALSPEEQREALKRVCFATLDIAVAIQRRKAAEAAALGLRGDHSPSAEGRRSASHT